MGVVDHWTKQIEKEGNFIDKICVTIWLKLIIRLFLIFFTYFVIKRTSLVTYL